MMNANAVAREYMIKTMDERKFSEHVLKTIEKTLTEQEYKAEIISIWNEQDGSMVAVFHISDNIFSVGINRKTARRLQQAGPYVMDRYLWKQVKEQGIRFKIDHYLYTVFSY